MNIPNLHDGYFEGFWTGPNKEVHMFLRALDGARFTVVMHGVDALSLSNIKQGNIIFDVLVRGAQDLTVDDIQELYGVARDSPMAAELLDLKVKESLQVLEINPSYGAQGVVSFRTIEVRDGSYPAEVL
jgi:hypothetical protein